MREPGNAKVEKVFDAMSGNYDRRIGYFSFSSTRTPGAPGPRWG